MWTHGIMTGGKENDGTMLDEDWATGNCIPWHAAFSEIPSSMAPSSVSSAKVEHSLGLRVIPVVEGKCACSVTVRLVVCCVC